MSGSAIVFLMTFICYVLIFLFLEISKIYKRKDKKGEFEINGSDYIETEYNDNKTDNV